MEKVTFNNSLENDNIKLERIKPEHLKQMFNIIDSNREILRPWLNWVDKMKTVDDFSNYVQDRVKWWDTKDMFTYVVKKKLADNKTSDIIGMISFKEIEWENKKGAFVLWLDKNYRGLKIANDMYDLVSKEAIKNGFETIISEIDTRNEASLKSINNTGFFDYITTREGEADHINPYVNIKWAVYKYKK